MPTSGVGGSYSAFVTIFLTAGFGGSYGVRGNKVAGFGGQYKAFKVVFAGFGGAYASRAVRLMVPSTGEYRAFIQERKVLYARNVDTDVETELGALLPGQTTLVDVPLADGTYEAEVRSDKHYWNETRSRNKFVFTVVGGVIAFQNVPNIQSLSISINASFQRVLTWTIPDVVLPADLKFGVWRSASSPVPVGGAPDFEVRASQGVGVYSQKIDQTSDEYYAVAAFTPSDQGPESEIFAPWDLTPESSPNQTGY